MPTRSHAETMARHSGPFLLVAWKQPADSRANRGLPLKYLHRPEGDPIAAALSLTGAGAESVNVWSLAEQQFVTTVHPGDFAGELMPVPISLPVVVMKGKKRGGEYAAIPGNPPTGLPLAMAETLAAFVECGSATVAEIATQMGLSTDVVASRATRLKGMGLLALEGRR